MNLKILIIIFEIQILFFCVQIVLFESLKFFLFESMGSRMISLFHARSTFFHILSLLSQLPESVISGVTLSGLIWKAWFQLLLAL